MVASTALVPLGTVAPARRRPTVRAQCVGMPHPCPWLLCRYNLEYDYRGSGARPKDRPLRGCVLDLIDSDTRPRTQREIATIMGLTFQRVEQIELEALHKLHEACVEIGISWDDFYVKTGRPLPRPISETESDEEYARHVNGQRLRAAIRRRG